MRIYYSANGDVFGTWGSVGDLFIPCDSHTNPTLAGAINADIAAYLVVDGVLTRDGVPVSINPPCDDCQTLALLDGDGALTGEQVKSILKLMTQKPGFTRG